MESSRRPANLMLVALAVLGTVTLMAGGLLLLAYLAQRTEADTFHPLLLKYGVPLMVGYPAALAVWFSVERVREAKWAWLLTALGILVMLLASYRVFGELASFRWIDWTETRPGGRGNP